MKPISRHIISYLSEDWKGQYADFLSEEHWLFFIQQFNNLLSLESFEQPLPYFKEEITSPLAQVVQYFQTEFDHHLMQEDLSPDQVWANVLENASFKYLLIILGQRLTPASITDHTAIPPHKQTLLGSCFETYNGKVSIATRAWEKHVGRSTDEYWGEIKGNSAQKETYVKQLISNMIDQKTWWNIFFHYKHEIVYEIRVESGHGIRWNRAGTHIIGFLEPFINDND